MNGGRGPGNPVGAGTAPWQDPERKELDSLRTVTVLETMFHSADLAPRDRAEGWREHLSRTHAPLGLRAGAREDFRAVQQVVHLGEVTICTSEHLPMIVDRTVKPLGESDSGLIYLALPLRGTMKVDQLDRRVVHGGDDFVFHDSTHSLTVETTPAPGADQYRGVAVQFPVSRLPIPAYDAEELMHRRIPADKGIGSLLAGLLARLPSDVGSLRTADAPRLERVVLDLTTALLAHVLDRPVSPPESRAEVLMTSIKAFITRNLADPCLSPSAIAAAHHISVSYLHRLFRTEETTVAALVRRRRLERARDDLVDSALRNTPIGVIAARWGFPHAADFSRTFRAVYGIAAKDYRHSALHHLSGPSRGKR
jgi:AraC-like DNA-binding protein